MKLFWHFEGIKEPRSLVLASQCTSHVAPQHSHNRTKWLRTLGLFTLLLLLLMLARWLIAVTRDDASNLYYPFITRVSREFTATNHSLCMRIIGLHWFQATEALCASNLHATKDTVSRKQLYILQRIFADYLQHIVLFVRLGTICHIPMTFTQMTWAPMSVHNWLESLNSLLYPCTGHKYTLGQRMDFSLDYKWYIY